MAIVPLTKGATMLVDDEDLPLFNERWHLGSHGYAMRSVKRDGKKCADLAHRLIAQPAKGMYVDHINGNKLDNRRCNLRPATMSQNLANACLAKNNTSGYRGVSYHKQIRRWVAQFKDRSSGTPRHVHIGSFPTKEQAAVAYNGYLQSRFGEFARVADVAA